ncbi:hypothetical protein ACFVWG_25135 [Kribbella sp. NPDC058245]|uniref:hypothetical protein n=1 Tax=Kribbella sp. NPDC058245 TaxID=3346399 RepID=UPI0036EDF048
MIERLARDALVVIFGGEEVPGMSFYGLVARGSLGSFVLPSDEWPGRPETKLYVLHGVAWEVPIWDLPVLVWPTGRRFERAVRRTLEGVIATGCQVAWVAAEGFPFSDPPDLFDPEFTSGGVLAWMTSDGEFECPLNPDLPLSPVSDERLLALRRYAHGLADAE